MLCFAPDVVDEVGGYDPDGHHAMAQVEAGSFWFRSRNRLILWARRRFAPRVDAALEIGCGTGFVLNALADDLREAEVWGSELFLSGLGHARQRLADRATLLQCDARRIPFTDHFDLVGAFDVLEHIDDDEAVIAQVHRALKSRGVFLINVPQHMFLWSAADEAAHHVRRYSRSELIGKLERGGFAVERATSFVSLLLPAMLLARWLNRDQSAVSEELVPSPLVNRALEAVLTLEHWLVRMGVSFPAGGSLFAVARKV